MCALGFAGFFRFNEIVNILPKHLELHDDFLKNFIPRSKTDVYREGNFVFIRKISGIYCPVNLILRYINMAGVSLDSHLPLFSLITNRLTRVLLDLVSYLILGAAKYSRIVLKVLVTTTLPLDSTVLGREVLLLLFVTVTILCLAGYVNYMAAGRRTWLEICTLRKKRKTV